MFIFKTIKLSRPAAVLAGVGFFLLTAWSISFEAEAKNTKNKNFSVKAIPNLFFNSDVGIGYGIHPTLFVDSVQYKPYFIKIDANYWNTTKGPMETYLFFDSPHLIPNYRLTIYTRYYDDSLSPFYGIGANSGSSRELYLRRRANFATDLQRTLWQPQVNNQKIKALFGLGIFNTEIDISNSPLLISSQPIGIEGGWTNYVKLGLVYDSRDNEIIPKKGRWLDILAEISRGILGSDYEYLRLTTTLRTYHPLLSDRFIYAGRILAETFLGQAPFYEFSYFANSYQWKQEALGGSKSLRGIPLNRYIGRTKLFSNQELRWMIADFNFLNQDFTLGANLFVDFGWVFNSDSNRSFGQSENPIKISRGMGVRLIWGQNFVIATDIGNSTDMAMGLYIGVDYLY